MRARLKAVTAAVSADTSGRAFGDALATLATDVPSLLGDVQRLSDALAVVRRRYADLVAAGRAALLAGREGEHNPWVYLVDELPPAPPGHPLWHSGPPETPTRPRRQHDGGTAARWCR